MTGICAISNHKYFNNKRTLFLYIMYSTGVCLVIFLPQQYKVIW